MSIISSILKDYFDAFVSDCIFDDVLSFFFIKIAFLFCFLFGFFFLEHFLCVFFCLCFFESFLNNAEVC